MKIVVFNLPAASSGALTILEEFYNEVLESDNDNVEWFFILSTPELKERKNVKVLNFPWVKNSWFHRMYFDKIYAKKILNSIKPDKVFSMQNTSVTKKYKEAIYLHQALPFSKYKFKILKNFKLWLYQNIIGKMILKSLQKTDKIIVQTNYIKNKFINNFSIDAEKISVIPPRSDIENDILQNEGTNIFFYPSSFEEYKNHKIILESVKKLSLETDINYQVILTINPNQSKQTKKMFEDIKNNNLPIIFNGVMSRKGVQDLYKKSILLFPSYIESFGLPLKEAKEKGIVILAADEPYAREVLDDYPNAYFFNPFKAKELKDLMLAVLENGVTKKTNTKSNDKLNGSISLVKEIINF